MPAANKGKQTELRLDIRLKAFQTGDKTMDSRERVITALNLKEPDRVPFMDFVDTIVKQKIMGTEEIDEAEFAKENGYFY